MHLLLGCYILFSIPDTIVNNVQPRKVVNIDARICSAGCDWFVWAGTTTCGVAGLELCWTVHRQILMCNLDTSFLFFVSMAGRTPGVLDCPTLYLVLSTYVRYNRGHGICRFPFCKTCLLVLWVKEVLVAISTTDPIAPFNSSLPY